MSDLWTGRLIIVIIIAVVGIAAGTFISSTKDKANESAADRGDRQRKYQKDGLFAGIAIGLLWVLFVTSRDHASVEKSSLTARQAKLLSQ